MFKACQICGAPAVNERGKQLIDLCPQGNCYPCHKTCTWEDCVTGTWSAAVALRGGASEEQVRRDYPKADIDRARTLKT